MTTLNKIVFDIASSQGREDDLSYIERLKFQVHQYRATIIRRDLDRNMFTPVKYLQSSPYLEMEAVNTSPGEDNLPEMNVYRTVLKVPAPIRFKDRANFYYVGTIDGKKPYSPIIPDAVGVLSHNKYGAKAPRYYYEDGHIYVLNTTPDHIKVRGVYEYPYMINSMKSCDDENLYTDDSPYPISIDLVQSIREALLNFDVRMERGEADDKVELDA